MEKYTFNDLPEAVYQLHKEMVEIRKFLTYAYNVNAPVNPEELMTIDDAAIFLKLAKPTIYAKVSSGVLPAIKPKGTKRLYFSRKDLQNYIHPETPIQDSMKTDNGVKYLKKSKKNKQ